METMAPPPSRALGAEIFSRGFRFLPTPQDAVSYYLPRLVAGKPLHGAVRPVVHHADVYAAACTPADLAHRFCPLPRTGDRFFFTPSAASRKRAGAATAQASRAGSWHAQTTVDIVERPRRGGGDGDATKVTKVGELRKLRYKKSGGAYTDWLMEEYSSGAGAGESQFALCKMYVSPRASPTSPAHKESAAYFLHLLPPPQRSPSSAAVVMQPSPAPAAAKALAPKRPAPPQPATSPPCAKRMRGPAVLPAPPPPPRPPAPPASAPTRLPLATVRVMSLAPPQPPCAPRRGSMAPSATQTSPAPAPLLSPPVPPARHAVQLHRSPMPLSLPTPRQPLAQPKEHVPVPLRTPPVPVAMASANHVPLQAPAPAPCPPQVFVVQPKQQRMTTVDPFEAAMLRQEAAAAAEQQTVAAAAPSHPPPPAPPTATPALQDEDQDEDDWGDLDKALGIDEDATPGLQDQDQDEDDWDDLDKALGID